MILNGAEDVSHTLFIPQIIQFYQKKGITQVFQINKNKTASLLGHTQSLFPFIRYLFRILDHKLWSSLRIYISTSVVSFIYMYIYIYIYIYILITFQFCQLVINSDHSKMTSLQKCQILDPPPPISPLVTFFIKPPFPTLSPQPHVTGQIVRNFFLYQRL